MMIKHVNGIDLNIIKEGSGPVLVMIHGNGEDLHTFDVLKASLSNDFTIITFDSRNHGESQKDLPLSYELMVNDFEALLDYFDLEEVSVLGFSDGGIISLMSSIRQNPRLKNQILLGINLTPQSFAPRVLEILTQRYESTGDDFTRLMIQEPQISDTQCGKVKIPTALVYAEKEPFTKESMMAVHQYIPHSTFQIMEGHDHGSYVHNSDLLKSLILNINKVQG